MSETPSQDSSADNEETATLVVGAISIVLAVLATILRFYIRFRINVGIWWDDWFALIAVITSLTAGALVLASSLVDPDAAWILSEMTPDYTYTAANQLDLKMGFIADILYFTIVGATKISILLMYTRIFAISRSFRYQVWALSITIVLFWIATTFASLFNCWPLQWNWIESTEDPPLYCINYNVFWLALAIVEEILDVCILILPVRQVIKLQLSWQKKVGIISIFLLGGFVIITGIVRAIEGWNPQQGAQNPRWVKTEIWSSVHASIGIVCASLPVCWPIIIKVFSIFQVSKRLRQMHSSLQARKASWPLSLHQSDKPGAPGSERSEILPCPDMETELLPISNQYAGADTMHVDVQYPSQAWDGSRVALHNVHDDYYHRST